MNKYHRKITAVLPKGLFSPKNRWVIALHLRDLALIILIIIAGIILQTLVLLYINLVSLESNYDKNRKESIYWESVVLQYPQIPDVLYNAAVSSIKVNNLEKSVIYLDKAIKIDPLFSKAIYLRSKILNLSN